MGGKTESSTDGNARRTPMAVKPRRCQRCRAEIPLERLEAIPETRLCIKCSEAIGSDFIVKISPENVGKTTGIKKLYGGIKIQKVRRQIRPVEDQSQEANAEEGHDRPGSSGGDE
jgi:hypothetical protein